MRLYQKLLITVLLFVALPLALVARFGGGGDVSEPVVMLLGGGGVAAAAALIRRHIKPVRVIHVTEG